MSYEFEGQTFPRLKDFQDAFPVYRHYVDLLRAGANTVLEMEKRIAERASAGRARSVEAAKKCNFSISKKGKGRARG